MKTFNHFENNANELVIDWNPGRKRGNQIVSGAWRGGRTWLRQQFQHQ
jgi:hypothetical protein